MEEVTSVSKGETGEGAPDPWTIRKILAWASDDLRKRGMPSPRLDVELLLGRVLGLGRVQLVIEADKPLSKEELAAYKALHQRRRAGEPVAYLLGLREFYGRAFRVDRRVLVPRPDTEILVEVALERMRHLSLSARALDLCTGSGCVAISLAKERPTWKVLGADVSKDALAVAEDNAVRLGASASVGFLLSDLFASIPRAFGGRFDVITANPPYIAAVELPDLQLDVRDFEPHLALLAGPDGLDFARRIISEAPAWLAPRGLLALEVGAGQAPAVRALFESSGFESLDVRRDWAGIDRIVSGVLPA